MLLPPPAWAQTRGEPADCNTNGIDDELDIAAGTSADCNLNGLPDECDLTAGTSEDCNANALPDECDLEGSGVPAQLARLIAADAAPSDYFGYSVALSGDWAVVGAYRDDDGGSSSGSAYVFVRIGGVWTQQAKLTAADAAAGDQFGRSVSVSGDTAVVGAWLDDDGGANSGSAYVFVRSGGVWTQQAKLTAADAAAGDEFGLSVALSGDTVVVGANRDDDAGTDSGSAYVFVRSGGVWTQQAKLTAADAAAGDVFGYNVALSGDTAVVGAYGNDDGGSASGSAYVFVRNGGVWTQQAKLTATDAAAEDVFGACVTLSGDTVVVGAYRDDDAGTDSGSAYVFVRSGGVWTQQAKLTAADAAAGDVFSYSVALSGDTAIVGAHLNNAGGTDSGSAYMFVRSGGVWTQQAKLTAADAAAQDQFGVRVALSGDTAVVGAYANDDGGSASGSAYVFDLGLLPDSLDLDSNGIPDECAHDCNLNGVPDALDIALGTSLDCSFNGLPDECEIAAGTSEDCNADGVPNDCELVAGSADDCNANAIPDECDLTAGTSQDCNSNALPDECDLEPSGVPAQIAKLTAADAAPSVAFGFSVALSGDWAVVGAPGDNVGVGDSGSAYVFVRSGGAWLQQAKLTAADAAFRDEFGYSVALSGDTVVVGAYRDDDWGTDTGSVYVFVRSAGVWTQQAKLTAMDATEFDNFGWSVALSGDTAIVGAPSDSDGGALSGSAFVFVRSGGVWTQQAKLTAADAAALDEFGSSVALSGDTAVVGAYGDDDGGSSSGSAYVFVRSGGVWTQQAKLTAADAAALDEFGSSVALSGDTALIGAHRDDDGGSSSGSAYVFVRSGGVWTQQAKLTAADAALGEDFGWSVALSGDTGVVGAWHDDGGGADRGSAYLFVRSGGVWTQQAKLTAADAALGDAFGFSVALSGDTAVVGAIWDDDGGDASGSAYVFDLGLVPDWHDLNTNGIPDECEDECNLNGVPDVLDIALGTSLDCNFNSLPDECELAASDCDLSGIPDDCEIATGTSQDCNANTIPDECDFAAGTSEDCNGNALPDECDLVPSGVRAQLAKLTAADAAANDHFGNSVALSGDTAVVGAVWDDDAGTDSGSAYVFVRSGEVWTQQVKLTAADAAAGDNFGTSVALSGDTAVVGAYGDDDGGTDSGSAYVFVRSGGVWTQQAKLTAADPAADDYFGYSVALSGDTAVVGAYADDDGGTDSGSAYVFVRSAGVWTQQAKLTAADAASGDEFGISVALSGDTAVVGAWRDDIGAIGDIGFWDRGSAYVFVRSGGVWTQQAKLISPDAASGDEFGVSVAVSGDTAIVGALYDDGSGWNSGSLFVFVRSGGVWTQQAKLAAADSGEFIEFGGSVALSGDMAIVGAVWDFAGGQSSGSAYVFDLGFLPDSLDLNSNGIPDECENDCNLNGVPDILDIAAGTSEDCNFTGLPDECELAGNDCDANAVPDECDVDTDEDGLPDGCDPCAGGAMSGDADGDGDVDGSDLADLASCLSGPVGGLGAGCECFDFDADGDIDLIDFAILQFEFTGPGG